MPDVVKVMRQQASPEYVADFWEVRYPGQIPKRLVLAEELHGNSINVSTVHSFGIGRACCLCIRYFRGTTS
jgi:hypothetical protein